MGQTPSGPRVAFGHAPEEANKLERDLTRRLQPLRFRSIPYLEDFSVNGILDEGEFGTMLEVEDNVSEETFALKILRSWWFFGRYYRCRSRERDIQMMTNFKFIMKFYWFYRRFTYTFSVFELSPYGSLHELLDNLLESDVAFIMAQLVLAVEYLHNNDVVHRDIKPSNIFIGADGYILLGDFYLAKKIKNDRTYTECGTLSNMAPEVIGCWWSGYGRSADWYSVGATMHQLLYGHAALRRWVTVVPKDFNEVVKSGILFRIDNDYPTQVVDSRGAGFMNGLLQTQAARRLGIVRGGVNSIKNHIWLAKYDLVSLYAKRYKSPLLDKVQLRRPYPDWESLSLLPQHVKNLFPEESSSSESLEVPEIVISFDSDPSEEKEPVQGKDELEEVVVDYNDEEGPLLDTPPPPYRRRSAPDVGKDLLKQGGKFIRRVSLC